MWLRSNHCINWRAQRVSIYTETVVSDTFCVKTWPAAMHCFSNSYLHKVFMSQALSMLISIHKIVYFTVFWCNTSKLYILHDIHHVQALNTMCLVWICNEIDYKHLKTLRNTSSIINPYILLITHHNYIHRIMSYKHIYML